MSRKRTSLKSRVQSFGYALNGLKVLLREEPNARIHLVATVVVVAAGFYFKISELEWISLSFAIGFVFLAETLNTSLEKLCDFVSPQKNSLIKKTKDLAAAAVLIAALTAVVVGVLIFLPKLEF